jgi:uncharacterized protein YjbJ (UPF0337 family)/tetrahydromethanopterin S-methyltransferase subunit G
MVNQAQIQGDWNQIQGKVRQQWGELSDDDLSTFQGSVDQLVGLIQRKTGQARESITATLDKIVAESSSRMDDMRHYAAEAGERAQETYEEMARRVQQGYGQAEQMVQRNPARSVGIAFGAGLLAGVVVGLVLRSR